MITIVDGWVRVQEAGRFYRASFRLRDVVGMKEVSDDDGESHVEVITDRDETFLISSEDYETLSDSLLAPGSW